MTTIKIGMLALMLAGMFVYIQNEQKKEVAFEECLQEVSNNCSALIEYAIMLENENARLNKLRRKCQK